MPGGIPSGLCPCPAAPPAALSIPNVTRRTTSGRVHAEAAPLRPPVGRGALLGRAHDRPRAAPVGPRGDPPGEGALRRLDQHPLLVPRRDLRLVRRADQRPTPGPPL